MRQLPSRQVLGHQEALPFMCDLFDPYEGHWEYSAVVGNRQLGPAQQLHQGAVARRGKPERVPA